MPEYLLRSADRLAHFAPSSRDGPAKTLEPVLGEPHLTKAGCNTQRMAQDRRCVAFSLLVEEYLQIWSANVAQADQTKRPCRIQHKPYTKPGNSCSDEFMDDIRQIEHRRSRRVGMKQPLRVRPLDPKDGSFEELGTTKNVSQGGVYFVTQREVYYEGMRLSVMVPYSATGTRNHEYHGKVTRVEELGNSQRGVAIRFVPSAAMKSSKF